MEMILDLLYMVRQNLEWRRSCLVPRAHPVEAKVRIQALKSPYNDQSLESIISLPVVGTTIDRFFALAQTRRRPGTGYRSSQLLPASAVSMEDCEDVTQMRFPNAPKGLRMQSSNAVYMRTRLLGYINEFENSSARLHQNIQSQRRTSGQHLAGSKDTFALECVEDSCSYPPLPEHKIIVTHFLPYLFFLLMFRH